MKDAKRRQAYTFKYIDMTRYERTESLAEKCIEFMAKKLKDDNPPSTRTLKRWYKKFIKSNGDFRVFITNNPAKAKGGKSLHKDVDEIVNRLIEEYYFSSQFVTIEDLRSKIGSEIDNINSIRALDKMELLTYPCKDTIYRRIKKKDQRKLFENRFGKKAADLIMRTIGGKEKPTIPMEVCEIDSTIMDVFVLSDLYLLPVGRPTLTVMIDLVTRTICGFYIGFDPASGFTCMYCLHHAFCSKDYVAEMYPIVEAKWPNHGLPDVLVIDNGKEFINESVADACFQLGVTVVPAPQKEPWFKGTVERWMQTQNTGLLHSIPGATFSDKKTPLDRLIKHGYDPEKDAVVTFSNLVQLLHIFVIDYYHQRQHKGLQKRIPSQVWKELTAEHSIIYPPSGVDLDALLGVIETRTLTSRGIEFRGLIYNAPELTELRFRYGDKSIPVIFKYDPADISYIQVRDDALNKFIPVPALNREYTTGLSIWEHEKILEKAKEDAKRDEETVGISHLFRARDKIRMLIERDVQRAKIRGRKKSERFNGTRMKRNPGSPKSKVVAVPKNTIDKVDISQPLATNDSMDFTISGQTVSSNHSEVPIPDQISESAAASDKTIEKDNQNNHEVFVPEEDDLKGSYDLF
jgi:putative transposase